MEKKKVMFSSVLGISSQFFSDQQSGKMKSRHCPVIQKFSKLRKISWKDFFSLWKIKLEVSSLEIDFSFCLVTSLNSHLGMLGQGWSWTAFFFPLNARGISWDDSQEKKLKIQFSGCFERLHNPCEEFVDFFFLHEEVWFFFPECVGCWRHLSNMIAYLKIFFCFLRGCHRLDWPSEMPRQLRKILWTLFIGKEQNF